MKTNESQKRDQLGRSTYVREATTSLTAARPLSVGTARRSA